MTPELIAILGVGAGISVLTLSLFTWLHVDIRDLRQDMSNLRDRLSSLEGFVRAKLGPIKETASVQDDED